MQCRVDNSPTETKQRNIMELSDLLKTAPTSGAHPMTTLCGTDKNPRRIKGLSCKEVKIEGKYAALHVTGTVTQIHYDGTFGQDLLSTPRSGLGRVKYEAGTYNLMLVQNAPQDWSGWL